MRKICFVTGARSEYGIMSELMKKVRDGDNCVLQVIVTNMHLSPEFGLTYKEIENDGIHIDKKVEMLLSSDTDKATIKSMGVELIGMSDAIDELDPDLIVILGDRYEMLQVATIALIMKIPVAHLYGGDITEGAYDNSIRHAITKLSQLHFASTEEYRNRIIQMGEQPDHVFLVGSLGVDNIKRNIVMRKKDLENSLDFELFDKSMLVTFHPVTMENETVEFQIQSLLKVLDECSDFQIIFTYPNSDGGGRIIKDALDSFVLNHTNAKAFSSLGKNRYYAALKYVNIVIGNSSSGICEAPSFGIPTLNIGNRQKGRKQGNTIINCGSSYNEIKQGLSEALSNDFTHKCKYGINPYDKVGTLNLIYKVLTEIPLDNLLEKHFYDIK